MRQFWRRDANGGRGDGHRPGWMRRGAATGARGEGRGEAHDDRSMLKAVFTRLTALGREIGKEAYRVLASSREIARQSKSQSDQMRASMEALEEVKRVAEESASGNAASRRSLAEARECLGVCIDMGLERTLLVRELVGGVEQSDVRLGEVGRQVSEVERCLEIIAAIGRQSDLLALNAAIEAARAGAQGQGFGVVAREMRTLADRTALAAEDIRGMADAMRATTGAASATLRAACKLGETNQALGQDVKVAAEACMASIRQAEDVAENLEQAALRQGGAIGMLRERWMAVRASGRECTLEADASAERSMRTISIASRFYDEMEALGDALGAGEAETFRAEAARFRRDCGRAGMEEGQDALEQAMLCLERLCAAQGAVSRHGAVHAGAGEEMPELWLGRELANGRDALVDEVERLTGMSATLFVRAQGPTGDAGFYRVATTLRKSDGKRATGTQLNPKGGIAQGLLAGERVSGYAYILGVPYLTAYVPLRDGAGDVVGAVYVGKAWEQGKA